MKSTLNYYYAQIAFYLYFYVLMPAARYARKHIKSKFVYRIYWSLYCYDAVVFARAMNLRMVKMNGGKSD